MKNVPNACPFCGHMPDPDNYADSLHPTGGAWREDPWGEDGKPFRHYMWNSDPLGHHGLVWEMGCLDHEGGCGATIYGDSREECIANWNRRQAKVEFTDDAVLAVVKALKELVKINEEHNAAVEKVIGRPLGWKDDYLNAAREALSHEALKWYVDEASNS